MLSEVVEDTIRVEQPGVRQQAHGVAQGLSRGQGGYELVLTPLVLALAGLWADGRLGITPVLTVLGSLVGFVTVFVRMYYGYRHDMAHQAAKRPERPVAAAPAPSAGWIERNLGDLEIPLPVALREEAHS